jgi:transposase
VLNLGLTAKVYLCTLPTDMRRGFDGLMRMAEEHLQRNMLQGGLFVFVNRRRDCVKLLYWDQDGLAVACTCHLARR